MRWALLAVSRCHLRYCLRDCFASACTSRSSCYTCCSCTLRRGLGSVRGRATKGTESSRGVTSCRRLEAQVSYYRRVDAMSRTVGRPKRCGSRCAIPADDGKENDSENESTVTYRQWRSSVGVSVRIDTGARTKIEIARKFHPARRHSPTWTQPWRCPPYVSC